MTYLQSHCAASRWLPSAIAIKVGGVGDEYMNITCREDSRGKKKEKKKNKYQRRSGVNKLGSHGYNAGDHVGNVRSFGGGPLGEAREVVERVGLADGKVVKHRVVDGLLQRVDRVGVPPPGN